MAVAAAVRDEGEQEYSCSDYTWKEAVSIQHSVISLQRFAFDSMVQEMNRTVIRGTERHAELAKHLVWSGNALSRAAISTDHGCRNAEMLPHTAKYPPSTGKTAPVTQDDSSLAR